MPFMKGFTIPTLKAERIAHWQHCVITGNGTNLTDLNPKEEKLIRHVGFSGHYNAGVMMDLIQRDKDNLVEGMLVAINANDKTEF